MNDITLLAAPGFLLLILIELGVDRYRGTAYYRLNDAFGSLALGIFSKSTMLVTLSLGAWVIQNKLGNISLPVWNMDNPWVWVAMFVIYDFIYYWSHRMRHEINFLWAGHSIHHSSEDYNLTTALRQTSSSVFVWVFSVPLFLLGAPAEAWFVCGAWNLIYQFWVHTRHIKSLGAMEWFMVTPSHHRVHHAQNARYIDKNHGGVFIIWDKMFGTFSQEDPEEEIIYGVRRPLNNLNPIAANFQVWRSLASDAWHTDNWLDKLRIWFMPTGWRPADVEISRPIKKTDLDHFEKFDPGTTTEKKRYAFMHLAIAIPMGSVFLFANPELPYLHGVWAWFILSAPLVTGAWLLQDWSWKFEGARIAISWPLLLLLAPFIHATSYWGLMAWLVISTVVFAIGYLSLNRNQSLQESSGI